MSKIFYDLPIPAIVTTANGVVVKANLLAIEFLGKDPSVDIELSIEHFMPKSSNIMLQNFIWPTLIKDGKLNEFFLKLTDSKNEVLPTYINASAILYGNKTHYCWTFFHVKERAEFEKKLIDAREQLKNANLNLDASNQNLLQANSELEQFTFMASHDLKEPLRSLKSLAEFMLEDLESGEIEKVKKSLEYILTSSIRMESLIDALLEYSRVGNLKLEKKVILIKNLVDDVQERLLMQIRESGLQIELDLETDDIFADYTTISLVIQNLLQNSMKFRVPNTDARVKISSHKKGDMETVVVVSDEGIGIAKEKHERIFQAFSKLHSKDKYAGSGIGLAIVEKTVKRHNGFIKLESEPDRGSCFSIFLPNAPKAK